MHMNSNTPYRINIKIVDAIHEHSRLHTFHVSIDSFQEEILSSK